ncbi:MAG: hypothetical protein QOH63_2383 [Acidobacteriota bacterium]|jgi:hypothetical protein|nr:hypothetical protein [Acidobacteriota bacterium]
MIFVRDNKDGKNVRRRSLLLLAIILCCLAYQSAARAQVGNSSLSHLTVYSAGIAEFLEERAVELQPGLNTIEWRSLMPKANIRTVRVLAEDAEVVRQDVTYDGAQVNNEKSPVLHLVIQNRGVRARKRVQVDYLAPNISWRSDYALVLEPTASGESPTAATLDSWVSLYNSTGVDIAAGTIDLVAGEVALLPEGGDGSTRQDYAVQSNVANVSSNEESGGESYAEVSSLSAFNRFTLGNDISLNANATVNRFPIFQHARLAIVQRNVFENAYDAQTLGRGGFILLPRGLEVRLVAKNTASAPMAGGLVTIYQRAGEVAQIVGQDRISFTPQNAEFAVTQGRSATLFGTRRVLERRVVSYRDTKGENQEKLVTRVEVVLSNRGARPAEAFVREGIERYEDNQWKIVESNVPSERLAANTVQFKVMVPAGGSTTVAYTVECE